MTAFDGWETQFYGYCLDNGRSTLAHYRTKGSKNGIRRYQTESGTWTALGLRERRIREGWGERRAASRERRAERRAVRAENRAKARAYLDSRKKPNVKKMTDDELRKAIDRRKMEIEYSNLTKSPVLAMGQKLIEGYFKAKDEKMKREERLIQLENSRRSSQAALVQAKAKRLEARNDLIDNLTNGAKRKEAKANIIKNKTERSKGTIRGAIGSAIGNVIRKEGQRFVKDMGDKSLIMRSGHGVKEGAKASINAGKKFISRLKRH